MKVGLPLLRRARAHVVMGAALVLSACLLWASSASAATACTDSARSGGEWPAYGHDLANSRTQPREHKIVPSTVRGLRAAWVFSTSSGGDQSAFQSNPVVDGGCAFIGSAAGEVYALNVASGKLVWKAALSAPSPGLGGAIVGAPVVYGDEVIVLVNESGAPYAAALDRSTGALIWRSQPVVTKSGYSTNASPVVANGLVVVGYSSPEGNGDGSGGFALLDPATGQIVKVTPTISPADQAQGYAGGGLWSTPAYDPKTHYLYWGAGNPDSKTQEDPHTNAILKIDLDRSHSTFGEIVDAYKGNVDQYSSTLQQLSHTQACAVSGQSPAGWPLDDPVCGQLDLDFGASAQLFTDKSGHELVGDLQKSGVYHAADATTMAPAWTKQIGLSCAACNAASTADYDGSVFGVGTPGGIMYSLGSGSGSVKWRRPIADGVHYQPTAVAGGVVYTTDGNGIIDAFSAATGKLLLRRPTELAVGMPTDDTPSSAGVTVAEHTVFVPVSQSSGELISFAGQTSGPGGAYLIAYRLPG